MGAGFLLVLLVGVGIAAALLSLRFRGPRS